MTEAPKRRLGRLGERALFITIALFVVVVGLAGHQYFASPAGRLRRMQSDARARPEAQALVSVGCREPQAFAPAEVAQLVHFAGVPSSPPTHEGMWGVLCWEEQARQPTCSAVYEAYARAGGQLPVVVMVKSLAGEVRCMEVRQSPTGEKLELGP